MGGSDTGARSAARLATRRLPRSTPPVHPSILVELEDVEDPGDEDDRA